MVRGSIRKLLIVLAVLQAAMASAVFDNSPYFGANQVRLSSYNDFQVQTYSFPNNFLQNLTSLGLSLSGYDFHDIEVLQFRAQVSYDTNMQSFEILISLFNNTRFYYLNYFILAVSQTGSSYIALATQNLAPNPTEGFINVGPVIVQALQPFFKTASNNIICVPLLKSIQSLVSDQFSYFNITYVILFPNSSLTSIQIYNNYSFLIEASLTLIFFHQTAALSDPFLTYAWSSFAKSISSAQISTNLNNAASNNFNIAYQYGPTFEPKCIIGIQNYLLTGKIRQTLNFNLSQVGITQTYASTSYLLGYAYFCIAEIKCSGSNLQYYPAISDCQQVCKIENCLICSSSTSCSSCQPSYFINALFRCSACSSNCLNCSSSTTCLICADGYFLNGNFCQVCPLFCSKCTSSLCAACQSGYVPVSNGCLNCGSIMPNCLTCSNPAVCTLCATTYYFNSNQKGCVLCNNTIPNCQTCNLMNNCLTCYTGFYLAGISRCSGCSYTINACCYLYVSNCTSCKSISTCSICAPAFYINSNGTCSTCGIYGIYCAVCNSTTCIQCTNGYIPTNNTCVACTFFMPTCATCSNSTFCLSCLNSMVLVSNQCYNCSSWPISSQEFVDSKNQCQPCSMITPHCESCSSSTTCLSCFSLYYIQNNECLFCQDAIPQCLACISAKICEICVNGYFLSLNSTQCLQCGTYIAHCGQCTSKLNAITSLTEISCQICDPEYFPNGTVCSSCLSAIPFCLTCITQIACSRCVETYYLTSKGICVDCPTILQGCKVCNSAISCQTCVSSYYLLNGFCTLCSTAIKNCKSCYKNNITMVCSSCLDSYYLDSYLNCSSCSDLFTYCQTCNSKRCLTCITGFYVASTGQCQPCSVSIPNCIYCSPDVQCLICNETFWLNSAQNSCDSCNIFSKGCASCQKTSQKQVNCSECLNGYALYPSSNLIFTCIACNVTILNCLSCSTPQICLICSDSSYINQYGTCSLCSLYISNCYACSNTSQCTQCKQSYQLLANGSCFYCNLSQFGLDKSNIPLCTSCNYNGSPICTTCTTAYYVSSQQNQCLSCSTAIQNCASCLSSTICISCSSGYYLGNNNLQCISCGIANCETCSVGVCEKCLPGSYMIASTSTCQICNFLVMGCNNCDSNICNGCADGYYLQNGHCIVCSLVMSNCLLCSNSSTCSLKMTPPTPTPQNPIFKPLAIIAFALSLILIAVLIIWRRIISKKDDFTLQEEALKTETDRKIAHEEVYTNEIELDKGKLCQKCLTQSSEVMRLELLCSKCDQILKRGHRHKIRKEIVEKKENKADHLNHSINEMALQIESKIESNREKNKESMREESRSYGRSRFEQMSSKKASTKATNDMDSNALRNMF